jgi:hypothetical protein
MAIFSLGLDMGHLKGVKTTSHFIHEPQGVQGGAFCLDCGRAGL